MTVGTVAQDRAVRLPVPDSVMAIDGAQGEGKGNAALFADLMAQLTIPDAADPDTGDEQPAAAEAKTEQPASETAASTPPTPGALQALLANALSTIVQDVKSETQLNVAVDAEASNDVLKLAQLIAQSAQGREGAPATDGAADAGEGKELKGIAATLEAWSDGPYGVAAPTTGAKEKRPMELSVVNVETHFAPVVAAELDVPADLKAKAVLPAEAKRDGGIVVNTAEESAVATTAVAGVSVEADAKSGGERHTDTAARGKPADQAETSEAASGKAVSSTVEPMQQTAQTLPVAKQIANEIAGAVQGTSRSTLLPADGKPGLSKLKVLHIQLQPESLGTVTVRMALRADTLELHIDAARAETADLIQRDREVLSSLLRAVGYRADDAQIIVTHADPGVAAVVATNSDGSSNSSSQFGSQAGSQAGAQAGSQAGYQAAGERSANSQGRDGGGNRRGHGEDSASRERDAPSGGRSEAAGIYL